MNAGTVRRFASDLRALVEVPQTSPHDRDRDTARILSQLSTPLSGSDPAPAGKLPILWRAVNGLAWTALVFAVAPSLLVAGLALVPGYPQSEEMTGTVLGLGGLALFLIWVIYLFADVYVWIVKAFVALTGGPPERS